jgi:hypothetical protein
MYIRIFGSRKNSVLTIFLFLVTAYSCLSSLGCGETGGKAPYISDPSGRRIDTVKIVIDSVIKTKDTSKRVQVQRRVEMLRTVNNAIVPTEIAISPASVKVIHVLKDSVITKENEKADPGSAENVRQALLGVFLF